MPRGVALTNVEQQRIRQMRRSSPNMPYREIGELFGVTAACVCIIVSGTRPSKHAKPARDMTAARPIGPNPQPKDSFIRALTPAELMAGNGTVCRRPHLQP